MSVILSLKRFSCTFLDSSSSSNYISRRWFEETVLWKTEVIGGLLSVWWLCISFIGKLLHLIIVFISKGQKVLVGFLSEEIRMNLFSRYTLWESCQWYRRLNCLEDLYFRVISLQTDSDFEAKPMVMLLGQYSTGKTTFIKHLLKCDYPGEIVVWIWGQLF